MISLDRQKFANLCAEDRILYKHDGDSIGTYNEKRFHRIFKRYITENAECYEVRLGKYFADVATEDTVYEIQTGSFASLVPKLKYYLSETEKRVVVIHPVLCEKTIVRAERESGEILRVKRSPKRGSDLEAIGNFYHLAGIFPNERLSVCFVHITAEEYRFSEARRHCKQGRYDSDLRPCELISLCILEKCEDLEQFLPRELCERELDTKQLAEITRLKGRRLYYTLNALCLFGVLSKRQDGKRNLYTK